MNTPAFLPRWNFDNTYAQLPGAFFYGQQPTAVREPQMVIFNHALAHRLGLDADTLDSEEGAKLLAGNALPPGALPIAQAYVGHQFGHPNMLGDGRALLLGEQVAPDGRRYDIQLKGSGLTPYSRRGDGRAALGPMLREYIISEAMHALGIPTTRSLAVVTTGEPVYRETVLQGAVLTRIAASHIRVGTFQYAAALDDRDALRALADYTIARHYPDIAEAENPYLALLNSVIDRQATLIAQWMHVGFIHGVMNTDNMAISGETIDYGPCAFMDAYDPATVFSSIDQRGRYAYGNQPPIAQWNLARLAECLLPLIHANQEEALPLAEDAVYAFQKKYETAWLAGMRTKLGMLDETAEDGALISELLVLMRNNARDYTNTFRSLAMQRTIEAATLEMEQWLTKWRARIDHQRASAAQIDQAMRSANPAAIPRNHLVEEALAAALNHDLNPLHQLLNVLAQPYEAPADPRYCEAAPESDLGYRTFCGT